MNSAAPAVANDCWQVAPAQNAQKAVMVFEQLRERIAVLVGHWGGIGTRLANTVSSCDNSTATLESYELARASLHLMGNEG